MSALGKRTRLSTRLGLTGLLLLLAVGLGLSPTGDALDRIAYDAVSSWGAPEPRPLGGHGVALVEIDQESLERRGPWPWDRALMARLVHRLDEAGSGVIGLDVAFVGEPEAQAQGSLELAAAVAAAKRVVLTAPDDPKDSLRPYAALADAAAGLGHGETLVDPDGIVRRAPLWRGDGRARLPALPLAMALLGGVRDPPAPPAEALASPLPPLGGFVRLLRLPDDLEGLRHYPAADVLDGKVGAAELGGAFVLVGVTASGLASQVVLAAGNRARLVPDGVYEALVLDRLLSGGLAKPLPSGAAAALLGLAGLVPYVFLGLGWPALFGALLIPIGLGLGGLLLFGLWLPFASALVAAKGGMLFLATQRLLRQQYQALADQRAAHAALESISDAVVTVDRRGRVLYANRAARQGLALNGADLVGRSPDEVPPLRAALAGEDAPPQAPLVELPDASGDPKAWRSGVTRIEGAERLRVVTLSDVTAERDLLREVAWQATHDALTGLPNRVLLQERLGQSIGRAKRRGGRLALAFLDLDRLKRINDGLGHAAGDALIKEVAARLHETARAVDTVARFGGDEFVVLLEGPINRRGAVEALDRMLAALDAPLSVAGHTLHPQASVGIALYPDHADGAEALLRHADDAMYVAKRRRQGRLVVFEPWMREGIGLTEDLRRALGGDELVLHYQPRVRLDDGGLAGFEALVRWQHPTRGLLGPGAFIGLAEETGLMVGLGRRVIDMALGECAPRLKGEGGPNLSVNLSAVQLEQDAALVDYLAGSLARHGLPPHRLELEVTEGLFLDPAASIVGRRLCELAAIGCPLAIDDFGTGYSSLAYLTRFPFSRIKIDRSFVQAVEGGPTARAIVQAIIALSGALDKGTTAEGIEHPAQRDWLKGLGCEEGQGYLFARPGPLVAVLDQ